MWLSLRAPSPSLRALAGLFPESSEMTSGAALSSLEEVGGGRAMLGCEGGQARRRWGALWSPSTNYKRPIFGEALSGADWGGALFPP